MPRDRITSTMLGDAVAALNRDLGREPGTPGAYGVLGAYGGYQLGTFAAAGRGSVDHVPLAVGHGYHSRRTVYDAVQAIRHGIQLGRQADAPPATVAVHLPRDLAQHLTRNAVLSVAYDDVIAYAMECRDAADRASWIADADALKHLHDHIENAMQEGHAL